MYRCEEGRQPVDIDLAVSVQVDEDCTGGLLRPPVLTADEASPLGVAHQPHLPTPLRRPHPLLQLHSCQNSMKLIYYCKCKIHMAIKKVKIIFVQEVVMLHLIIKLELEVKKQIIKQD